MNAPQLAVIMTCHNRREKTLKCLEALQNQVLSEKLIIQVYLVNDGSTDGTEELVRIHYPSVKIIQGNGNLFWNGGMRLAFAEAIKHDYDYYLWLNDDTFLYPSAVSTLLSTAHALSIRNIRKTVIVGSTQDEETKTFTYGGMVRTQAWHPLKYKGVEPGEEAKLCSTMNGNCVLIPRDVVAVVGNLDPAFAHSTGDIDYGLRVQQQGGSVWIAPGYVGTCSYNPLRHQAWDEPHLSLRERWSKINQPRGLPIQEWKIFSQRHGGTFWFFYWLLPYVRLVLKSTFN